MLICSSIHSIGVCVMKISCFKEYINFKAGKVSVYSDFDGTYCPAKHSSLHNKGENLFMNDYSAKMDNFLKSTEGDLHFHVTTGRTFGEYEAISSLLEMQGFNLPYPESFIAKNGSDEYIKTTGSKHFPYKYTSPNKVKEEKIKILTGWNGEELKTFIRELTQKYRLKFIEADSENSVKDYGNNSLFSQGKLNADEWKKLPNKTEFVLGCRKDGNLKVNLVFSPDYGKVPERNYIYDNFMNEIKNFLNSKKWQYCIEWDIPNKHNHYRNHCNITPKIDNKALTKLYDTKEAVKNAIKNNDMVIVAGDGSNDFDMLNPLEYLNKENWDKFKSESSHPEFYNCDMNKKLTLLKDVYDGKNTSLKQELERNGFLRKIEEIPLYSIVIKKNNSKLAILSETFRQTGKIIEVENGEIDKGIKELVKNHSQKNKTFESAMSDKFKKFMRGKDSKKNYVKFLFIGLASLLCIGSALMYFNFRKIKQS